MTEEWSFRTFEGSRLNDRTIKLCHPPRLLVLLQKIESSNDRDLNIWRLAVIFEWSRRQDLALGCCFRIIETSRFGAWLLFSNDRTHQGFLFFSKRSVPDHRMIKTSTFGAWLSEWSRCWYLALGCYFRMIETSRFGTWLFEWSRCGYLALGCSFSNDRDVKIWCLVCSGSSNDRDVNIWRLAVVFESSRRQDLALGCCFRMIEPVVSPTKSSCSSPKDLFRIIEWSRRQHLVLGCPNDRDVDIWRLAVLFWIIETSRFSALLFFFEWSSVSIWRLNYREVEIWCFFFEWSRGLDFSDDRVISVIRIFV